MKKFKLLIMDVDGTLTNGKIWMGNEGEEYKAFDVKDGYGIAHLLPLMKITPVVITGRKSEIVERRCRELGILECHQEMCIRDRSFMWEGQGIMGVALHILQFRHVIYC